MTSHIFWRFSVASQRPIRVGEDLAARQDARDEGDGVRTAADDDKISVRRNRIARRSFRARAGAGAGALHSIFFLHPGRASLVCGREKTVRAHRVLRSSAP